MTSDLPADSAAVAASVLAHVMSAPATLGDGRLICIDGPAGAGKTTLSQALEAFAPAVVVVHCDDLLQGWQGLPGLADTIAALVRPLSVGQPGQWRRWDWLADSWAETRTVEPGGLVVLEGVGSWSPTIAPWVGSLVWVEAPSDLRLARGLARDGEDLRPQWIQWRRDESDLLARLGTRARADLVITTG